MDRCSTARAYEARHTRGKPVKLDRFAACSAALPQRCSINTHQHALQQPRLYKSTVFGSDQYHQRWVPPRAQQDDAPSVDDLLSQLDDLAIPDIDQDLRTFQEQAGALFLVCRCVVSSTHLAQAPATQDATSPPVSFGNDDAAEDALMTGAVVVDRYVGSVYLLHTHCTHGLCRAHRSDCVRVRVAGTDCRSFLHNMTTNTFLNLPAGSGCNTVQCIHRMCLLCQHHRGFSRLYLVSHV